MIIQTGNGVFMVNKKWVLNGLLCLSVLGGIVQAKENTLVTAETFIRAETDNMFAAMINNAGGTNTFFHFRQPTPLDKQTVVRMNRDVLYSGGVFDAKEGLSVTFPQLSDERYASVYIIDNDHYVVDIIHEPGTYKVKSDTEFVYIIVRIQVKDSTNKNEIASVNALQNKFKVVSNRGSDFPEFKWNRDSLDALRKTYEAGSKKYDSWAGMMGERGKVNEQTRHFAAAAAWGLLPEYEATYLNYQLAETNSNTCYFANYAVPENNGFWSITVYGDDGYMKSDNNVFNQSNTHIKNDGTFDAYFGSEAVCGKVKNRVDVSSGWNFLFRIYRPGESVLNGSYKLPVVSAVK